MASEGPQNCTCYIVQKGFKRIKQHFVLCCKTLVLVLFYGTQETKRITSLIFPVLACDKFLAYFFGTLQMPGRKNNKSYLLHGHIRVIATLRQVDGYGGRNRSGGLNRGKGESKDQGHRLLKCPRMNPSVISSFSFSLMSTLSILAEGKIVPFGLFVEKRSPSQNN